MVDKNKTTTNQLVSSINDSKRSRVAALDNYVNSISSMNKRTAHEYYLRLNRFQHFIMSRYGVTLDDIISRINEGSEDPYEILISYVNYLQTNFNISTRSLKDRIITAKNFLEYCDVDISPRKFKLKVKLPKVVRKNKEALSKEDVTDILNACSDIRLKTYVMLLAATGMRATEALSIRIKDLDLKSNPAKVFVRGEYTKTKTDRIVFLTEEITKQLNSWLNYKYRTRRVCYREEQNSNNKEHKTITEYRTPEKKDTDLIFALYENTKSPVPRNLYTGFSAAFAKTLDRMNKGEREEGSNGRRRQITLHSFRRFVKTTISDLGYSDFSEYFIGHNGSTYWRKKESEKAELFKKIEPYLTFLNVHQLERQGADIQSKVEELEDLNQALRNRDKIKDDAIAQLSDQVMALTVRMQEFERKQSV
ncbi:MAG: tyrosine-type recombinase/integrase [Thermoproteota archaeon]|nr:tyrosine-type recombinase/integrase [Thermoproteota archaeon]